MRVQIRKVYIVDIVVKVMWALAESPCAVDGCKTSETLPLYVSEMSTTMSSSEAEFTV